MRRHDFVRNSVIHRMTPQLQLSSTVKYCRLFTWTYWCQQSYEQPSENWRRPQRRPCTTWLHNINDDLSSFGMKLSEPREATHNWPFWSRGYGGKGGSLGTEISQQGQGVEPGGSQEQSPQKLETNMVVDSTETQWKIQKIAILKSTQW